MRKKTTAIPVNQYIDDAHGGISIEKIAFKDLPTLAGLEQSERHDCHSFFLVESGTISMEIDFQKFHITPSTIIYLHPNQVHRILAHENVTVNCWAITNENLNPEYLALLEDMTPTKPLILKEEMFSLISQAVSLFIKFSKLKNDKLHHSLLKDSCNTLVALVTSQYLEQIKSTEKLSRFDSVTKAFKKVLERHFTTVKSPTAYAQKLNISTAYLNECVKNATGYSVSHHIQERLILEAKRLLYHSNKSVKEIAIALGYDDYAYFSRLFTKVSGMTALAFRNKNHE
jgi:AraC family transcriptional regulator, transcriptional activator of pobA